LAQLPFGITQSSTESERQDQTASSSEEEKPAETVLMKEQSQLIAEVVSVEVIADAEAEFLVFG
jgi:hypothetical protein